MTPLRCVMALIRGGVVSMAQPPKSVDFRWLINAPDHPSPLSNRERWARQQQATR